MPTADTRSMEVRGNLRPLSDTQELFLNFSRRLGAVSEWSFLFGPGHGMVGGDACAPPPTFVLSLMHDLCPSVLPAFTFVRTAKQLKGGNVRLLAMSSYLNSRCWLTFGSRNRTRNLVRPIDGARDDGLPYGLKIRIYLEDTTEGSFGDESVTIRQSLR